MDDIASVLRNLLQTKEGQDQLKNIQTLFSTNQNAQPPASSPPSSPSPSSSSSANGSGIDLQALLNALGASSAPTPPPTDGGTENSPPSDASSGMPNFDVNALLQLQALLKNTNTNDKNSQLLLALKPHFGERRREKVDQAIHILHLISLLPALQESGLLKGMLNGL